VLTRREQTCTRPAAARPSTTGESFDSSAGAAVIFFRGFVLLLALIYAIVSRTQRPVDTDPTASRNLSKI